MGCRNVRIEGQKEKNFSSYPFQIKTINLQRAFVIINYYSLLYRITSSSQEKNTTKKTYGGGSFLSNPKVLLKIFATGSSYL